MKRYVFITLKVLLICMLVYSVFRLASLGAGLVRDRQQFEQLSAVAEQTVLYETETGEVHHDSMDTEMYDAVQPDTGMNSQTAEENKSSIGKSKTVNTGKFQDLIRSNRDFYGWIRIEGTPVDYPVMWTPDEPDYYLHHDFYGKESKSGVPYIGKNCSPDCDNTILYAHNMKNGTMFAALLNYADENYYRKHPTIVFDTIEQDGLYDIIAVFREKVHYSDETGVFRYYNYCGELDKEQFDEYVDRIKEISFYDTGITAAYGQKLLTLSTCSYHTENGRFVVVAVKR